MNAGDGAARMTVVEHLTELRRRLIISAVAVAAGAVVAFIFYDSILDVLKDPYCDILPEGRRCTLVIIDPLEGFTTRLKVSTYAGLVLASPVVLWQVWRFITPGLHSHEKRYAIPFILSSLLLFVLGGALALLTFPRALDFLVSIGGGEIETFFNVSRYLGLVTLMMVAFGLAFEFPIVLVFLQLAGVLESRSLRRWRRGAIVAIVAAAAVITPSQDPYSLFAMAIPMYVFYEMAILVGKWLKR